LQTRKVAVLLTCSGHYVRKNCTRHSEKYPCRSAHENPSFCWTTESTARADWFTSQVSRHLRHIYLFVALSWCPEQLAWGQLITIFSSARCLADTSCWYSHMVVPGIGWRRWVS